MRTERGFGGIPYREGDDLPLHFGRAGPTFDGLNAFTQRGNTKICARGRESSSSTLAKASSYDLARDPG